MKGVKSQDELRAAQRIREAVEGHVRAVGLTREQIAVRLDLLPVGVDVVFARQWGLKRAFRIAARLGLAIDVVCVRQE